MKPRIIIPLIALTLFASCQGNRLTSIEKRLINTGPADSAMYVLSVFDAEDSLVLRKISNPVKQPDNKHLEILTQRMLITVTHPEVGGVGIAAPQVGINRRIILVQRFDKEDEPFEAYFNPVILSKSTETVTHDEGCLSIPGCRGPVERPDMIEIKYIHPEGNEVIETVQGFTARIFQHEIDHLDGILYTDLLKADSLLRKLE
ncbi:MAG: peptide deformylase [Bacteroidales bacterium]|nr:peptide deformylase [Bacteroidales bacterium]